MNDNGYACPRCGAPLHYDAATGLLWCPGADCGLVVRREEYDMGAEAGPVSAQERTAPAASGAPYDATEWTPEPRRRRILKGLVVFATAAAVLAMVLTPLLRPQRSFLSVSPAELSFVDVTGTGVMPKALALQNRGGGSIEWHATVDVPWLALDPPSGSIESELQILTIKVDTVGMPEGTHFATLSITGVGALNSPQSIPVHVQLIPPSETRSIRELLGDAVEVYYGVDPPYVSGSDAPIHLVQNEEAVDVTWRELSDFLARDGTDEAVYIQDVYMCGAFSEALHNNAEAAGIRAAWVSLDMRGRDIGHALNAFLTVDRGLVFVDCTGGDAAVVSTVEGNGGGNHDKVAYVRPGMECGLISLEQAESTSYEFYTTFSDAWTTYLADVEEHKRLQAEWSAFVDGRLLVPGSSDAHEAQRLRTELHARFVSLKMQQEVLGACRWEPLGIVDLVRVYW